jgi:hypothetical protein
MGGSVRSCGIYGGQIVTVAGFLRVLRFSLSIRVPPIAPQSSSSEVGTIGQTVVAVPNGLSFTARGITAYIEKCSLNGLGSVRVNTSNLFIPLLGPS